MSSKNVVNVSAIQGLFSSAASNGEMTEDAANIMINSLNDTNVLGCTGVDINDLSTDDVTLASIILDGSYSMKGNELAVREAFDEFVVAMTKSKQADSILISTRIFSTKESILYGFKKVADVGKIGSQYVANGDSTRLYDTAVNAITAIRAYAKTLNDGGVRTKCIIAVFTDGRDNDSQNYPKPDAVKKLADDAHKSEMFYLVYVGFKNDPSDNLEADAKAIGFPNVLTTTNDAHAVRQAMGLVSQSIIRKSQTSIGPSNTFFN